MAMGSEWCARRGAPPPDVTLGGAKARSMTSTELGEHFNAFVHDLRAASLGITVPALTACEEG